MNSRFNTGNTVEKHSAACLRRCAVAAVSGVVLAMPLIFQNLWFAAWLCPAVVLHMELCARDEKHAVGLSYLRGACFFFSYGLVTFSWFWKMYPMDYMGFTDGESFAVVFLASVCLPLLQASVSALSFLLIYPLKRSGIPMRHPYIFCLYYSCVWVVFEWLQTLGPFGVPWGRLAITQVSFLPVIQCASLFGAYFVSFIVIFVSCALAISVIYAENKRRKASVIAATVAAAVFAANIIFGIFHIAAVDASSAEYVTVAAAQGNILFEDKWNNNSAAAMEIYKKLSIEAANDGARLIVWPETAVPDDISTDERIIPTLEDIAKECNAEILYGVFQSEDGKLYNSICRASPTGADRTTSYKKQKPVPFGEYVPGEALIELLCPPLAELSAIDYPISSGSDSSVFDTSLGKISCLVCFDSVYGDLARHGVCDGGELICVSTNDSWFDNSAAQQEHNSHSVLRAVECGRYVVRAANTGISSIITPTGKVSCSLGGMRSGYVIGNVRFLNDLTLYDRLGNVIVPLCAAFCAVTLIAIFRKKGQKSDRNKNR